MFPVWNIGEKYQYEVGRMVDAIMNGTKTSGLRFACVMGVFSP